eukprot:4203778-Alexandrium_andersonii.AAC.1
MGVLRRDVANRATNIQASLELAGVNATTAPSDDLANGQFVVADALGDYAFECDVARAKRGRFKEATELFVEFCYSLDLSLALKASGTL